MDRTLSSISEVPNVPAVYIMLSGKGRGVYVAYVGVTRRLKGRIMEHLVRRDSSVVTGASGVALNPDYVSEIRWWEHPNFDEKDALEAAELIAFDVFDPALRSRGGVLEQARRLYENDTFHEKMHSLFSGKPTGKGVRHK